MISVVICSVSQALAAQVKRNIDTSIGVPWELILLDNSVMKKGITEVYNIGAARSNYGILCFVHEDVLFGTQDWGKKIVGYFEDDPALGAVGVAGAKYKSKTPSGWSTGIVELDCCNILHIDKNGKEQRIYSNPSSVSSLDYSVTLDGVFICVRKEVWQETKFDEQHLKGFHLYDIDFSFRISLLYRVAVTFAIDITHLTEGGDFGNAWLDYTIIWHRQNEKNLPRFLNGMQSSRVYALEKTIKCNWLERLKVEKISAKNRIRWILAGSSFNSIFLFPGIIKFLIFRMFKKLIA